MSKFSNLYAHPSLYAPRVRMAKRYASYPTRTGLPPTATRLPIPDARFSGHRISQDARRQVFNKKPGSFSKIGNTGIVGPR
jgi:hypothetical protein